MVLILFPNQLFADALHIAGIERVILHQHPLFFTQYQFHKEKITLHKESMAQFAELLKKSGKTVEVTAKSLGEIAKGLSDSGLKDIAHYELCDEYLGREFRKEFGGFT